MVEPALLILITAFQDHGALRKVIDDVLRAKRNVHLPSFVLVVFDRPYSSELAFYKDAYGHHREMAVVFKDENKGKLDSLRYAIGYAKINGFDLLMSLDDDLIIDPTNFHQIVDEVIHEEKRVVMSPTMIKIAPAKGVMRGLTRVIQRVRSSPEYGKSVYVDGRFHVSKVAYLPSLPSDIQSEDHYLTVSLPQEKIGRTDRTTVHILGWQSLRAYLRSELRYRINALKLKRHYPNLYQTHLELVKNRSGKQITGLPLPLVRQTYRRLDLRERSYHRLSRLLTRIVKSYASISYFLMPNLYESTGRGHLELAEKNREILLNRNIT